MTPALSARGTACRRLPLRRRRELCDRRAAEILTKPIPAAAPHRHCVHRQNDRRRRAKHHLLRHAAQRAQILLATLLLLGLAFTLSAHSLIGPGNTHLANDAQSERALAQAREALIAYASGRATTARPSELPCPDTDNNALRMFPATPWRHASGACRAKPWAYPNEKVARKRSFGMRSQTTSRTVPRQPL